MRKAGTVGTVSLLFITSYFSPDSELLDYKNYQNKSLRPAFADVRPIPVSTYDTTSNNQLPPDKINLINTVISYKNLQDDWNGERGHPAAQISVDNAIAFLLSIINDKICSPKPYTSGDKEIGFFWRNDMEYADLIFTSSGKISWYICLHDGSESMGTAHFDKDYFPETIKRKLECIYANEEYSM